MMMLKFARWHIWLGWIAAIPLLLWTISGLFMALRPIEDVRGETLRAPVPNVTVGKLSLPPLAEGQVLKTVTLVQQASGPVWLVSFANGAMRRANAATGAWMGGVSEQEARQIATATYTGEGGIESLQRLSAEQAPFELRRPRPSWQAKFPGGVHMYVDADTGEVMAMRTRWWRAFDFMWGLHIMAPMEREDTSHPVLIITAIFGVASCVLGSILLFRRRKARKAKK